MKFKALLAGAGMAVAAATAQAAPDVAQLQDNLKRNACVACHAVDKKLIGPGYNEVAEKYQGDEKAAAVLAEHVRKGSSGVWGPVPMPPNPKITDEDLATVIDWIMAGA